MAYESEDIRKRQRRRTQDKRRQQTRSIRRKRHLILGLIAAAVVLALSGLLILLVTSGSSPKPTEPSAESTLPVQTQPTEPQTTITISFGGDLNVTDQVVSAGAVDGGYDYTGLFRDIVPALAGSDASVVNLEGILSGTPYGTDSGSAPQELAEALAAAGVDLVQLANTRIMNNGLTGLRQTISGVRNAGMEGVGAFADQTEVEKSRGFTLRDINGVKVAFVSFTKGFKKGELILGLPPGGSDLVNLLYADSTDPYSDINTSRIKQILQDVALEKPDVTIALLHWGSAYNGIVSDSQKKIVNLMQSEGVDAIIGTHSHYVQNVEFDPDKNTFVAYSLGDLLGNADKAYTNASTILQLEFTKDNTTGTTKITGYSHTPVYIATPDNDGVDRIKLLSIEAAMAAYEANSINKVSDETYTAMKAALARIKSRVEPEEA